MEESMSPLELVVDPVQQLRAPFTAVGPSRVAHPETLNETILLGEGGGVGHSRIG